ncbi:MAG TPA: DUF6624 domain-containing protein [Verrucomicrobiae bacterium]|nr:DUF6624 domain-containing protein [Verrucomicrobiae bacterium]
MEKGVRLAVIIAAGLLIACNPNGDDPKAQLESMYDSDQAYRTQMQEVIAAEGVSSMSFYVLWAKQAFNDWSNVRKLDRLIDERGWPSRSVVGEKGATAAFLVIQHASLDRQKKYQPLLQAAAAKGEAPADQLALLEDRILMREGRKQKYGSQLQMNDQDAWEFYPIENEPGVDERRKAVGLPPLADYAKELGVAYHAP